MTSVGGYSLGYSSGTNMVQNGRHANRLYVCSRSVRYSPENLAKSGLQKQLIPKGLGGDGFGDTCVHAKPRIHCNHT